MKPGLKARRSDRFRGDKVTRIKKPLTRKERRRQERTARKQRAALFHTRTVCISTENGQNTRRMKKKQQKRGGTDLNIHSMMTLKGNGIEKERVSRNSTKAVVNQSAAMVREDKEIARLEKLLKMKKRKKLPTSFKDEGLDYLLDLTDRSSSEWNLSDDDSEVEEETCHQLQQESDSEPEETAIRVSRSRNMYHKDGAMSGKLACAPRKGILKAKKVHVAASTTTVTKEEWKRRVRFSLEGKSLGSEGTNDVSDSSGNEENVEMESEDDESENDTTDSHDPDMEDFDESSEQCDLGSDDGYVETDSSGEDLEEGRSEDEPAASSASSTYVPPHLREEKKSKSQERLTKTVQGLINRLSESNMQSISSQVEQLYRENSRNDMNTTLSEILLKSCVSPALLSDRLALEHMMLVAVLHHRVGQEVGAHVVQCLIKKLGLLLGDQPNYGRGKECDCIVLMLAHLYNYRVIHCLLIYDIIRKLVESFTERDVELLLLLLKSTGMEIRKDDAASLKDIILQIQSKAISSDLTNSSRMRFMLDTIAALRTNNARKIPNYDPSLLEHMKKLLRGIVRSSASLDESQLKISLQDLLNADTHGRWWIIGSAWVGRETNSAPSHGTSSGPVSTDAGTVSESWVLELARRQRMNTDIRKNIFCVIMTSEDYIDAFEKLVKLGLKEVQEREIIHVLVDCCLQEKTFNPYYAHLGQKFCEFKRSHQVTFQYALWDRFKILQSLTVSNHANLRKLACHLVSNKSLSLSVLKVVDFGQLEEIGVKFYKSLLRTLLVDNTEEIVTAIFARVAPLPALTQFRTELILFIKHFLGPLASTSISAAPQGRRELLAARIKLAEQAMKAHGHVF